MSGIVADLFGDRDDVREGAARIVDYALAVGLPLLILLALAVWVPQALARRLPETLPGLGIALVASWVWLALAAAALLVLAAFVHGGRVGDLPRLVALTALFWAPVTLVVALQIPRGWRPDP
ncbi:MAG: hypothetical protein ACU0CO_02340 [Shimia sp.]